MPSKHSHSASKARQQQPYRPESRNDQSSLRSTSKYDLAKNRSRSHASHDEHSLHTATTGQLTSYTKSMSMSMDMNVHMHMLMHIRGCICI